MSTKISRGQLKKLAQQGKLEIVHKSDKFADLEDSDFRTIEGYAQLNEDGTVRLGVYRGRFFDLRITDDSTLKPLTAPDFKIDSEHQNKVQAFADKVDVQIQMQTIREYPGKPHMLESHRVKVTFGKKFARVDVGNSGRYMVDLDGNIFGIKGYGVVHRGHYYGTLDTIEDWKWGDYRAVRIKK